MQLSGIWLGLWASACRGAAQSASMIIRIPVRLNKKEENGMRGKAVRDWRCLAVFRFRRKSLFAFKKEN